MNILGMKKSGNVVVRRRMRGAEAPSHGGGPSRDVAPPQGAPDLGLRPAAGTKGPLGL